jgi:hypothetical protein
MKAEIEKSNTIYSRHRTPGRQYEIKADRELKATAVRSARPAAISASAGLGRENLPGESVQMDKCNQRHINT